MRVLLALALILVSALPGVAETVRVRSGEHDAFSRLVFEFSKPTAWRVEPLKTGYRVILERSDISFDFTQVFRYIPRDRLTDVTSAPSGGELTLALGCPCHAEFFEIRPGTLVVDIKPGADPAIAALKEAPTSPQNATVLRDVLARPSLPILGGFIASAPPAPSLPARAPAPPTPEPDAAQIAELQKMLLKELSRAAAQGMVEADIAPPPSVPTKPDEAPELPPPAAKADPAPTPGHPGIHVETSLDRANIHALRPPRTDQGAACLPERYFDLASWGREEPGAVLIAEARRGVVEEFDRVNPAAQRHLVTTYLYLGFGAEARAALTGFGPPPEDARVLLALADILDFGATQDNNLFDGQLGCAAPVALWAALAAPALPRGAEIDRGAIETAFSALPMHLRRHLGPGLAERFLAIGDRETATRLRNTIARAAGDHGSGFDLMEARIDLVEGHPETAEATLHEIAARDDPLSAVALGEFLESKLAEGRPPDPEDLLSADALAFENRGTALGDRLARASSLGSALAGDFIMAFEKLGRADPAQSGPLRAELLTLLAQSASDADFLRQSFALLAQPVRPKLDPAIESALATRLLALGFPDEAAQILPPATAEDADILRLLRAQIAMAEGDAVTALRQVAGIAGQAVEKLRGEAYAALGNLGAAEQHFAEAAATPELATLAWQMGDWGRVADLGSPAQRELAADRLANPPGAASGEPSLAAARDLLVRSATTRALMTGLLGHAAQTAE